jgi:hypothetical protein
MIIGTFSPTGTHAIITPKELMGATSYTDASVTNLAVLLQSLDSDGNASNGIDLTSASPHFTGATPPVFDFKTADENTTVAFAKTLFPSAKTVTAADAAAHMFSTLNGMGINTSGTTGGNSLTCKHLDITSYSTPTATQIANFAATYTADEWSYNTNDVTKSSIPVVLSADGTVSYDGKVYPVTSACLGTLSGGTLLSMDIGSGTGYVEFSNNKKDVFGGSPTNPNADIIPHGASAGSGGTGGGTPAGKILPTTVSLGTNCTNNDGHGAYTGCNAASLTNFSYTIADNTGDCTVTYANGNLTLKKGVLTATAQLNGNVDNNPFVSAYADDITTYNGSISFISAADTSSATLQSFVRLTMFGNTYTAEGGANAALGSSGNSTFLCGGPLK